MAAIAYKLNVSASWVINDKFGSREGKVLTGGGVLATDAATSLFGSIVTEFVINEPSFHYLVTKMIHKLVGVVLEKGTYFTDTVTIGDNRITLYISNVSELTRRDTARELCRIGYKHIKDIEGFCIDVQNHLELPLNEYSVDSINKLSLLTLSNIITKYLENRTPHSESYMIDFTETEYATIEKAARSKWMTNEEYVSYVVKEHLSTLNLFETK